MYKTLKNIRDLQDNEYFYEKGALYPRKGYSPSDKRLKELVDKQVIVKIEDKKDNADLTVKELKDKLSELKIDFDKKATKKDLLKLLDRAN